MAIKPAGELVSVVDLTSSGLTGELEPGLAGELATISTRLHVLDGLLDALEHAEQVQHTIRLSSDRYSALKALQAAPFHYSQQQAEAVLDMPVGWHCLEQVERLREDRDRMLARRASLASRGVEVLACHWFG
ncbi:MAG TPA: hypothetical protein VED59_05960 [Acidimicrobiales bacterium]|nr:hypothetical protein [Acidimicrobiales bacterium]